MVMISADQIRTTVFKEGFAAYGFSDPVLKPAHLMRFKKWINAGYQADMQWIERNIEQRLDIRERVPWVKSVLAVADNYFNHIDVSLNNPRISRYALGGDYHEIVKKKLLNILSVLEEMEPGIIGKVYVDTGPVLERAFAAQAGLGWIGKNSSLIVNDIGSYCFLGELILNVPAKQSNETEKLCGNCTKCIEACPTGAIIEPGLIDSRKCISYLTIEKQGDFTSREEQLLNNWLFGCDVCQECCPWNQKWGKKTGETRYINRLSIIERSLNEWLEITEEEFKDLFTNSSVKRLHFDRFRRNLLALISK
ncbi:MAG: tRNA epoxyqueuosine(34) reductase QueG [Candidatus Marinimicrobia bacterium]|nr:tRNA epoxyqueuosine(34) reductase QueG [Candidatus Neomarinimicrobiota bacterium]MBL7066695.1 tRNA epoxyqueuosine(34) reductase QueG [Candidatus Neomarinimicrobiota bacterium]